MTKQKTKDELAIASVERIGSKRSSELSSNGIAVIDIGHMSTLSKALIRDLCANLLSLIQVITEFVMDISMLSLFSKVIGGKGWF